jgi:hypothetical protein
MASRSIAGSAAALLVAASVLAASLGASAQTAPAQTQAPSPIEKRAIARAEARIAELHTKLHITAAEQPQWDAFTAVMRENAMHAEESAAERGDPGTMTALEEMRGYTAMAAAHAADMQKMLPAFEALYNSMPPDQQKLTDTVFRQQETRRRR